MCSTIIVWCSWDGLPEGRNCSCVWSFWCSELCSIDQNSSKRECAGCEGPEWFYQLFCSLWMSTVLGECGGLYQWFAQQSGLPSVSLLLVAELSQAIIEVQRTDSHLWMSHFRSWDIVVSRNLNDSSAVTVLFMMESGGFSWACWAPGY